MEKVKKLRKLIKLFNLDGYCIPKNDEFFGEYIPKHKDRLRFITNFSGSYGFSIILKNKNFLFVDGRYSLQAKMESGKKFKVFTLPNQFPFNVIKKNKLKIGFDPKIHTRQGLLRIFKKSFCKLVPINQNLIDKIWFRKSNYVSKKFYTLPEHAVGKNYRHKINKVIETFKKLKVEFQFISSSENVSWLLNIRGQDSEFAPITNAYLTLDIKKRINLFCDLKKIDNSFKNKFKDIKFIDTKHLGLFLSKIKNKNILVDPKTCSIFYENYLNKNNKIRYSDPISILKSIKSKNEIRNIMNSHLIDGLALTRFLFWIKKNYTKNKITEIGAQNKLLQFRKKNKNFKFLSFPTISGSGPNGAIIHYKATKNTNRVLQKGDIYLVDSGGQYNFGTTDVTRTISLENKNKNIKDIFTRVLKGHIEVATFKLRKNTSGAQIDIVARKYLKKINLDYPHGTGHGVGYFLNVHEGPQGISKSNKNFFKEGMVVSNEPGYYKKSNFGIRIENLIRVKKTNKTLLFDNLTMVPIDKSLIKKTSLTNNEINWINNYHNSVYKNLKKLMNKKELLELKEACSKI